MRPFDFVRASDPGEAAAQAGKSKAAAFVAGGTNLIDLMKLNVMAPDVLVDISRLGLDTIDDEDGGLRIGATVTNSDLAADLRVRRAWPLLARALLSGASGQLRNKATTAGNLLQRTRCPYFHDTDTPCNKRDPGAGCAALGGEVRNHAILGTSEHCIAQHPSDMAVAMLALDATVRVRSADGGERDMPLDRLHRLPGDRPDKETGLDAGDLITSVFLPRPAGDRQIYRKVRDRASYAFALTSVAVSIAMAGGRIRHAAIAFGGLGTKPWRDPQVDAVLAGEAPSPAVFEKAADTLLRNAQTHGGNDFKVPLARRVLRAVLEEATA